MKVVRIMKALINLFQLSHNSPSYIKMECLQDLMIIFQWTCQNFSMPLWEQWTCKQIKSFFVADVVPKIDIQSNYVPLIQWWISLALTPPPRDAPVVRMAPWKGSTGPRNTSLNFNTTPPHPTCHWMITTYRGIWFCAHVQLKRFWTPNSVGKQGRHGQHQWPMTGTFPRGPIGMSLMQLLKLGNDLHTTFQSIFWKGNDILRFFRQRHPTPLK